MKIIATIIFLFLTTILFVQDNDFSSGSFTIVKLDYELLDTTTFKSKIIIDKQYPNIVSYFSDNGLKIAYCSTNKNKLTSVFLKFDERTDSFKVVNFDKKGQPEIILYGQTLQYGSGGGTALKWLMIINIDSVPTQIFKINYGLLFEDFGDKTKNGEGAYSKLYERQIKINKTSIIISPLDEKNHPCDTKLTEIPNGTYIMKNGRIRKKK